MNAGRPIAKRELIEKLTAMGINESSAQAYVTWSKRDPKKSNPAKGGNPFGFVSAE
jgi:hypothetical protein